MCVCVLSLTVSVPVTLHQDFRPVPQICSILLDDMDLIALHSSRHIYNYLHISNVSLQAHYSVMSTVLLLAAVQPSGVLVWKSPS